MACVDRVAKNGDNKAQSYKYAMAADVYEAIRSELTKRFVTLSPSVEKSEFFEAPTKAGGVMRYCTLHVRFTLTDAETGETDGGLIVGQGSDSGDKGVYKAMTGATKAFLINKFLIPTGDDPENEPKVSTAPPPAGMDAAKARMQAAQNGTRPSPPRAGVAVFPNYGKSKGAPVAGASLQDLEYYANGARRTLADPAKARFHDAERRLLAAIEAEVRRQNGVAPPPDYEKHGYSPDDEPPPQSDADAPPF